MRGDGPVAKTLLVVVSVLLVLGSAEVALSLFHPDEYRKVADDDLFYEILHRKSATPGLLYELSPNRQKKFEQVWIRTNSYGMRGAEPLPVEDPEVTRIVTLGDSFTFGFRVGVEEAYPSVLEDLLGSAAEGNNVEVLNLGVCGYNTLDEAIVLEHKALYWQPDLIVVGYVLNDPETDPIQPLNHFFHRPKAWERFILGRVAAQAKHSVDVRLWGGGDYYRYLHNPSRDKWRSVVAGLEAIHRLAEERDIPVLVVIFPDKPSVRKDWQDYPYVDIHQQVAAAAEEEGFAVLDLLDAFSEHPARLMRVRRNDAHPSPQAHRIAAAEIFDWITRESSVF